MPTTTPDLRYPTGRYQKPERLTPDQRAAMISTIVTTPERLRAACYNLTDAQLDAPYRDGGWTVRQLVHHVADSHMNAYIRFKLALTESNPTIKPYDEKKWAELADTRTTPVETSLALLELLHERWANLLHAMAPDDFARTFMHPENGAMNLDQLLALYAWHGPHHTAHITNLRDRMSWW